MKKHACFAFTVAYVVYAVAQDAPAAAPSADMSDRDRQMRDRYEKALLTNPLQDQAFDRIYESYLAFDGVNAWIDKLKTSSDVEQPNTPYLILLGRVYARQFKNAEAITALEQARNQGEDRPEFKQLLGSIYYDVGRDEDAAQLLSSALDQISDPDKRGRIVRILGTLYQRQGKTDEAIAAWKRLVERDPNDLFALLELAAIYEENRMWDEAIATYSHIASLSDNDPYRKCRSLRSIAQAQVQQEKYTDAVATYEKALELVAPGNWLFEDIKLRLVSVYQDMGELQGLVDYVLARLSQSPGDIEFRDLLAETYTRMAKFDLAETEYKQILERDPKRTSAFEKLIELYQRQNKTGDIIAIYEKLIELFPTEPDYVRRLGETHLQAKDPERAKQAWQRIVATDNSPENHALLAEWFEQYEFPDEAIAAYEQAVHGRKNKEWSFRLAALKHEKGEEDAALQIWLGLLDDAASTAADYAEVASVLESYNFNDKAEPLLAKAVEMDHANLEYAYALAKNLMRQKRVEEALPHFEKLAAQMENEYFQDQGERGMLDAYTELGVLKQKQEEWERDLESNPTDHARIMRLGRMYERLGDRPKAITLYERGIDLEPGNVEYRRTLATAFRGARQLQQAIDIYNELIEKDKDRAGGYYRELLTIYMDADMRKEALETAQRIVEAAPSDPEARLDLAQVYMNYREPEKALEQYRYALRLEPDEPDYFRQYGDSLIQEKRYGEALEAFRKMLAVAKEDDTRRDAIVRMSNIYQQQGNLDELIRELNDRIRNTPKKLAAYQDLAAVYSNQGDNQRAIEALETGLDAVDDKVPALQALVRVAFEVQDLPKVVSLYEQLLAMSGKPGAQEYERLGSVYAQLGEQEKARETWNKIVEEDKNNPKAYVTLAKALMNAGFQEEALAAKAQALALDPTDLKLRFAYAQDLSNAGQMDQALEQLQELLTMGDIKQKEDDELQKEKKVKQLARGGGRGYQNIRYAMSGSYYYSGGRGWTGSFADFRPEIVTTMVAMAENSIGIDSLLEDFRKKIEANPANFEAQKDLVLALRTANRAEEAIVEIDKLLAAHPDDIQLLEWSAGIYTQLAEYQKAIEKLTRIAELQPVKRKDALLTTLPMYFQSQQPEKAKETMQLVLAEYGDDPAALQAVISALQQQALFDEVKTLRPAIDALDPRYRYDLLYTLAYAFKQTGDIKEAGSIFTDIVENADSAQPRFASTRQARLFVLQAEGPQAVLQRYSGSQRVHYGLSSAGIIRNVNYRVASAAGELLSLADPELQGATLAKLESSIESFKTAASTDVREKAWDAGKMLIAYKIGKDELDAAKHTLDAYRAAGMDDVEWFNLAVFINAMKSDYASVLALYDEVDDIHPAVSRDAARARVAAHILAGNYTTAADELRSLMKRGIPPALVMDAIRRFQTAGEKELTKALLEEHLSGLSRDSEALAMLAQLYSEVDNIDKAIELAREAWDRRTQRSTRSQQYMYTSYGAVYFGGGYAGPQPPENVLGQLHGYYAAAGKTPELIAEFEDRLAKQPGSIELHRHLASLYTLSKEQDKAIEVWSRLIEKRPNLTEAKMAKASLLTEKGRFDEALAMYEDMLAKTPSVYRNVSWRVRDLYRRMGKGEQLAKMEENMVTKATNPDQMQELAWRYREEGEIDKAVELLQKAIKLAPNRPYLNGELARTYADAGRIQEALDTYVKWLDSPLTRAQGWVDYYAIDSMVGYYRALGRLDELKAKTTAELTKNPNDKLALAVDAATAKLERRFADARQKYETILTRGQDMNVVNQLVSIAEYEDDPKAILELVEKSGQAQNYWGDRLAVLYLAAGDRVKAYEAWKQMVNRYGGTYGYTEVMRNLAHHGLWTEAEDFYTKHRKTLSGDDWAVRELDQIAARAYVDGRGFAAAVEQLKTEPAKGASIAFIRAILARMAENPSRSREFLQPFLEKEPENEELISEMAKILNAEEKFDEALPLYEKLVAAQRDNERWFGDYANCLARLGREDEAEKLLRDWLMQRLSIERGPTFTEFLYRTGRWKQLVQLKQQLLPAVDPSLRDTAAQHFAELDARIGSAEAAVASLKEIFDRKKDRESFQQYFRCLQDHGFYDDAYALFVANKDAGFLDQWYGENEAFADLCLQAGDLQTMIDHMWKYLRYGDRYNREWYLDRIADRAGGKVNLRKLFDPLEARIQQDAAASQPLRQLCANINARFGNYDRAIPAYVALLETNPLNADARSRLATLYDATGRYDDEIKLLSVDARAATLQEEINNAVTLARAYFRIGTPDEGMRIIHDIAGWAKDANTSMSIGTELVNQQRFDEALPFLERAAGLSNQYSGAKPALAQCYAKAGRLDDAMRVAKDCGEEMDMGNFAQWLLVQELYDGAIVAASEAIRTQPGNQTAHVALIRANIERGTPAEAFRAADNVLPTLSASRHKRVIDSIARLLASDPAWFDAILAAPESAASPAARSAIAATFETFASLDDTSQARLTRDRVVALPFDEAQALIQIGLALNKLEDRAAATPFLANALAIPSLTETQEDALLTALVDAEDYASAFALVDRITKARPGVLIRNLDAIPAIARAGTPEQLAAALARVRELAPFDSQAQHFEAVAMLFSGKVNEALTSMTSLVDAPSLQHEQLNRIAQTLAKHGQPNDALRAYARIAKGGFGVNARNQALLDAIKLARDADIVTAVRLYAQLLPLGAPQSGKARRLIAERLTPESLPEVREAVLAAIQEQPDRDRTSDLIGFYCALSGRIGTRESAESVALAAGVGGIELEEAKLWDRMVEDWTILGAIPAETYRGQGEQQDPPFEKDFVASNATAAADPSLKSVRVTSKDVLRTVEFDRALGLSELARDGKLGYAAASIISPDDRDVTFAFGADDVPRVWVNGLKVFERKESMPAWPDQDRFKAKLNAGENVIIIRLTNNGDDWEFCLGFAQGGDGLTIGDPPVWQATASTSIAQATAN